MTQIGRRLRAVVNPVSTAATEWWCHSGLRRMRTGYGPAGRQRRLVRAELRRRADQARSPEHAEHAGHAEQMRMRAAVIDELLRRD